MDCAVIPRVTWFVVQYIGSMDVRILMLRFVNLSLEKVLSMWRLCYAPRSPQPKTHKHIAYKIKCSEVNKLCSKCYIVLSSIGSSRLIGSFPLLHGKISFTD